MSSFSGVRFVLLGFAFVFLLSLKSVSTIPTPHASDDFKTDSALFLPPFLFFLLVRPIHVDAIVSASLSRVFFSQFGGL